MPQYLTVGHLIRQLQELDPNLPVRLAVNPDFPFAHFVGPRLSSAMARRTSPTTDRRTTSRWERATPSSGPDRFPTTTEASISSLSRPAPRLALHDVAVRPMPHGVHSALLQRISPRPDGPLDVTWLAAGTPRLPLGRIRLRWEPASRSSWDVTVHLGLTTAEVLLGSWPAAPDDWPLLARPTLYEVTGLCAALSYATDALDLSNRLAGI